MPGNILEMDVLFVLFFAQYVNLIVVALMSERLFLDTLFEKRVENFSFDIKMIVDFSALGIWRAEDIKLLVSSMMTQF
jgi:hypothetical protein